MDYKKDKKKEQAKVHFSIMYYYELRILMLLEASIKMDFVTRKGFCGLKLALLTPKGLFGYLTF